MLYIMWYQEECNEMKCVNDYRMEWLRKWHRIDCCVNDCRMECSVKDCRVECCVNGYRMECCGKNCRRIPYNRKLYNDYRMEVFNVWDFRMEDLKFIFVLGIPTPTVQSASSSSGTSPDETPPKVVVPVSVDVVHHQSRLLIFVA